MNERGQVFTLDMFFALVLTAMIVSYSGLALEQARRQSEEYALRYSLERTVNDAADVLVKTLGKPENWDNDVATLETPGLTEESGGNPVPNLLSVAKFVQLRELCRYENWDTTRSEIQVIMDLFGESENFEIKVISAENDNEVLWDIWPGWDEESSSGVEDSLEVAVVKRLVAMKTGNIRGEIRALKHATQPEENHINFFVYPGELDVYDWYILLNKEQQPATEIWVNRSTGGADYNSQADGTVFRPRYHGEDDLPKNNSVPLTDVENNGNPNNYLKIRVTGNPGENVDISVVAVPRCSPLEVVESALRIRPVILEVKLWR